MPDLGTLARVVFFLFVVVLAGAVGGLTAGGAGSVSIDGDVDAPSFNADDSVATVPEQSGELSMSADAEGAEIVIDTAHSASIDREALAPIVTTLTENGATVRYHVGPRQGGQPLNDSLSDADALVVLGGGSSYTDAQLDGLRGFTDAGGRVLVMDEPEKAGGVTALLGLATGGSSVPSPLAPMLSQYGLAYDNGYLYTQGEETLNYRAVAGTPTGDADLTAGVDRAVFYEATPVTGGETVLAAEETTLSQTRREGSYGVVARSGNVVAVGDTSVVTQEFLYQADNEQLVGNLLDFLVSGEKSPANAPNGESSGGGSGT
ncbi:DUF4350 domain-containing protein [Halolamina sediminis]|uniref:DUF4350 domain-containing protein n=1 Tax=Halolamina sediminis TaxID=1480675 RepID=UPI0006B55FFE|nr:DUF4350 domain-containing protein [Halolamina sediminis]